jgi:hypothetical protein
MEPTKINVVLEKGEAELFARITFPEWLCVTAGKNIVEIEANLKELIQDHRETDGKDDTYFQALDLNNLTFEYNYDLTVFFEEYNSLKVSSIAALAGINESLLRQYVSGIKHPSAKQVQKIEQAVHTLGEKLISVHLI